MKAAAAPATRADNILQTLAAKRPPLTNDDRAGFAAKYADAKCEAMGAGTKSEGVLRDALAWAPLIDKSLTAYPAELRRYSPDRFTWYLACVSRLAEERALQQAKGGTAAALKVAVEHAEKATLAARTELLDSLEELVDGNAQEEAALSAALGTTKGIDRIAASVESICRYARGWLARTDETSKRQVKWSGLTLAEIETAEKAAATLVQAAAGKTHIPKLVPGPATRGVLVPRAGKGGAEGPSAEAGAGATAGGTDK